MIEPAKFLQPVIFDKSYEQILESQPSTHGKTTPIPQPSDFVPKNLRSALDQTSLNPCSPMMAYNSEPSEMVTDLKVYQRKEESR